MSEGRISAQEAEELAACFTADAPGLFRYACVLTRSDRALADDLVQAAFEAAGRAWPVLRCLADEQRRAWLRTTLANTAVSGYRREAAFRDRLPRIESRYRVTPADPAEYAFSSVVLERCWKIIQALPERQHVVAMLRWQQDMKESEIAAALVQDAFVAVHDAWDQLQDTGRALAYLRRCVVAGSRSWQDRPVLARIAPGPAPGRPVTGRAGPAQHSPELVAALDALPALQREALVLRYYAGLPEAEMAAVMGISRRSAAKHLTRALPALRGRLPAARGLRPAAG